VIRDPAISFFLVMICLAATFSVASGAIVDNSRIFFDCSTQGFPGFENQGPAGFSAFKTHLEESGCRVDDTISRGENLGVISSSTLSGYDTVFIVNPLRTLSRSEIDQLTSFAENGGTLVVVCDSPKARTPANLILQRFDLSFQRELLLNTKVNALPSSPVVQCAIPLGYGPDNELEPLPRYEWVEPDWLAIPHATNQTRTCTLNGTAGRSYDLLTGTERYGGERVLMVAIPASNGTVIALGTKELLTNYRYAEGGHLTRVLTDLFEMNHLWGSCAMRSFGVAHYPDQFSIKFKEGKTSLFPLTLANSGDQPVSVDISASDTMKGFLDPVDMSLLLEAGENATVYFRFQDRESMYGYVQGDILLTISHIGSKAECTSTIPFEAEHV
jgi:hypothetical protein